jgi:hypothetical protein
MDSEKSPAERFRDRSDDEVIAGNLEIIETYFFDIFKHYSFSMTEATVEEIVFANRDFEIVFGYERNRYGFVGFMVF